jgi:hypothetical protein
MRCGRCNTDNSEDNKFCGKCGAELCAGSNAVPAPGEPGAYYCGRHPKTITRLRCGRCEIPICPNCIVYTPAGARCKDCSRNKVAPRPAGVAHETGRVLSNFLYGWGPYRYWYIGMIAFFLITSAGRFFWMFANPPMSKYNNAITADANAASGITKDGRAIYKAINDYRAEKGKYPENLQQLAPKYIALTQLHTVFDNDTNPAHVSWTYYKPSATASPRAPMIETPVVYSYGANGSGIEGSIVIDIDGSSNNDEQE